MSSNDLNIIINNSNTEDTLNYKEMFFGDEEVTFLPSQTTIYDCLVLLGVFKSKSEARKNWKGPQIIPGYQEIKNIGKYKKALFILNLA